MTDQGVCETDRNDNDTTDTGVGKREAGMTEKHV